MPPTDTSLLEAPVHDDDSTAVPEAMMGSLGAPVQDVVDWDAERIVATLGVTPQVAELLRDHTLWGLADIAEALGVSIAAPSKWRNRFLKATREIEALEKEAEEAAANAELLRGHGQPTETAKMTRRVTALRRQVQELRAELATNRNALPPPWPQERKSRDPVWAAGTIRLWAMRTQRMTTSGEPTQRWRPLRLRPGAK
jgi:hypothetical protein